MKEALSLPRDVSAVDKLCDLDTTLTLRRLPEARCSSLRLDKSGLEERQGLRTKLRLGLMAEWSRCQVSATTGFI